MILWFKYWKTDDFARMKKNIFKMQISLFLYVIGLVTRFELISFEILEVLCITISRMTV